MRKTYVIACWLLAMLVCSTLPLSATTVDELTVRLPTEYITMRAEYGPNSWFDMTLSNVSPGFDVVNGRYLGWCSQNSITMRRGVNHTVVLYSSYDQNMPELFRNNNWSKVNYVLNHKQGDRQIIQQVIWFYTCNCNVSLDPQAQLLINETEINGKGFVPSPGQTIAIIVEGITEIQRTFFELQLPSNVSIGDLVWNDFDADGIQDAGEPGIPGVTVELYSTSNEIVATTNTDIHGYYSFSNFTAGNYSLRFILPQGYKFSPQNQGTDDKKDSDADPSTGRTVVTAFNPSGVDMSWDAGMYIPNSQGQPVRHSRSNHAPTADGTAGEPYKGFVGEEIRFIGSRSYDMDGTIVSWHWSFGDGATADGVVVTHAYTAVGSYTVTLTVTDNAGATDTFTTIANIRVPNRPPLQPQLNGPIEGHRNTSYSYSVVTTDPDTDDVQYMIEWGDGSQNTSSFYRSGYTIHLTHQWGALGFYLVSMSAQDPSNATSDVYQVLVSIDVRYVGSLGYLINTDGIGPFDMFYSNQTKNQTVVHLQNGNEYLIDTNGDGSFDHLYNTQSGSLKIYPETLGTVYIMLLVGVVVVILLIALVSFIMKRKRGTSKE